jgi:hypothetical protein
MSNLIFTESKEDYQLPSMTDKGDIIVHITGKVEDGYNEGDWIIENYTYDHSTSPFWINEGMGVDYFISNYVGDNIPSIGYWTIENITGYYIRGDGWEIEDTEEYEWEKIRPATEAEVKELET